VLVLEASPFVASVEQSCRERSAVHSVRKASPN